MDFTPLTDEQRQHFDEQGYIIIPGAIDQDTIEAVTEVGDRFMETQDDPVNYYSNRYMDMMLDASLIKLITNPRTLPLVIQLLSPDLHLLRTHLIYKYPQPASDKPLYPDGDGRSFRNWHRDLNNFTPHHPIRNDVAIRVGYCLTDFSEPNSGVTMLVPGSHKLHEPLKFNHGELDPPDYIEPKLKPGDAYLFTTRTYHTPAVNFTDHVAKVILVSYAYQWYTQGHPRPDEGTLASLDAITTQLFDSRIEGDNSPLREWARSYNLPADDPPMRVFV